MPSSQCRRVPRYPFSKFLNIPRHTGINLEQPHWFLGAMTPRSLDLLFPCFLAFKFLRAQGLKLSKSQVPESSWITMGHHPPWNQGPYVPSFLGFWSTTVCRHLGDRGLSAIKAPGTACSFNSLGFKVSRRYASHDGSSNLVTQAARVQGLKLIDPTRWPDRHGSWPAWSQGVKRVQFTWFSGQLGLIVNLASTHRATWNAMTPSFAGFLVHR